MRKTDSRGDEIYSYDVFKVLYEYEISRSKRYPSALALLKIEITPIALSSELLGSASSIFTSALNAHLRSVDIPCGAGNSYSVLLPSSDEHGARAVCERLLSVFKNKFDIANGAVAFSIQVGATSHGGGSTLSAEGFLQKAEEALKQSKLKGPNTYILLL